jgi:hypothetical protein
MERETMERETMERETMEALARQVRAALEANDLSAYSDLLDPNVTWGPPHSKAPPCRNPEQVLAWYRRAKEAGARAGVSEVVVIGDRILVGLMVTRRRTATAGDGEAQRWQALTVRRSKIVDIVGFDEKSEAMAHVEEPAQ